MQHGNAATKGCVHCKSMDMRASKGAICPMSTALAWLKRIVYLCQHGSAGVSRGQQAMVYTGDVHPDQRLEPYGTLPLCTTQQ